MRHITVIAHNIRSTHNIGAIFRTCEGLGVNELLLSGYSPYPESADDNRLPHISRKLTQQIHKTALGAQDSLPFRYVEDIKKAIDTLRLSGCRIVGLEQDIRSHMLHAYDKPDKIALILGEEVEGIEPIIMKLCDDTIEIPMSGRKESFNVSVAAGIALYELTKTT